LRSIIYLHGYAVTKIKIDFRRSSPTLPGSFERTGRSDWVHRTSAGFRPHFRDSGPNPVKNAGQAADSAFGGFVRQVPTRLALKTITRLYLLKLAIQML
jgi:hypothetical protein